MKNLYLGIDIGGTNTSIAIADSLSTSSINKPIVFVTNLNFKQGIKKTIDRIRKLATTPRAIGVSIAGAVKNNELVASTNLSGWINKPIEQTLKKEFLCPVVIENDAIAGSLGEAYLGLSKRKDFFFLSWGTGIGCAIVEWIDNKPSSFRPDDRRLIHELESKIGGKSIECRFGKKANLLLEKEWHEVCDDLQDYLPKIASLCKKDFCVIGGGIAVKQSHYFKKRLIAFKYPKIQISQLKGHSGCYGALMLNLKLSSEEKVIKSLPPKRK